jgi:hypothetical protein
VIIAHQHQLMQKKLVPLNVSIASSENSKILNYFVFSHLNLVLFYASITPSFIFPKMTNTKQYPYNISSDFSFVLLNVLR